MKKSIIAILFALFIIGCDSNQRNIDPQPKFYRVIDSITSTVETYKVTVQTRSGGNTFTRMAGGALLGGGLGSIMGHTTTGAVAGSLLGAATTDGEVIESQVVTRSKVTYKVYSNGIIILMFENSCPYTVGDSIPAY